MTADITGVVVISWKQEVVNTYGNSPLLSPGRMSGISRNSIEQAKEASSCEKG